MEMSTNMETIKFMKMIVELTKLSKNKIIEWKDCPNEIAYEHITYNKDKKTKSGLYQIPLGMCTSSEHHDAYCYYDSYCENTDYEIGVLIDEDENPYVAIKCDGYEIVIEDGKWYFV